MSRSSNIVVGVDGSEHADRAVRWAASQAALEHRPLLVVAAGTVESDAALSAAETVREQHPEVDVQSQSSTDDARTALLAASESASLLVVGSRGRGPVKSLLLGSVSSAVCAHAACPTVVCRPVGDDVSQGVVVGADGTPESRPVIEFAYRQASLHGLSLTVLHSFWDARVAVAHFHQSLGEEIAEPRLDDLEALLSMSVAGMSERYPDVTVDFALRHGLTDEALAPRGGGWSLVVVGRHPATRASRMLLTSISLAVVERASTTVAVVPEQESTG